MCVFLGVMYLLKLSHVVFYAFLWNFKKKFKQWLLKHVSVFYEQSFLRPFNDRSNQASKESRVELSTFTASSHITLLTMYPIVSQIRSLW